MRVFLLLFVVAPIYAAPLEGPYSPSSPIPHEVYGVPNIVSENTFSNLNAASTESFASDAEKTSVVTTFSGGVSPSVPSVEGHLLSSLVHQPLPLSSVQFLAAGHASGVPSVPSGVTHQFPSVSSLQFPQLSSISGILTEPGLPTISIIPSTPQLPSIAGYPSLSAVPLVPGIPHSQTTSVNGAPAVSGVHLIPSVPQLPSISGNPSFSAVSATALAGVQAVSGILSLPELATISQQSAIASVPSVPGIPSLPETSFLTDAAAVSGVLPLPQLPTISQQQLISTSGVPTSSAIFSFPQIPSIFGIDSELPSVSGNVLVSQTSQLLPVSGTPSFHQSSFHQSGSILQSIPQTSSVPELASLVPEFQLNIDIPSVSVNSKGTEVPSIYGLPLANGVLYPTDVPKASEIAPLPVVPAKSSAHDTPINEHNGSGISIQHEYGLPAEEKPLIISSAPELPQLQALPQVTVVPSVPERPSTSEVPLVSEVTSVPVDVQIAIVPESLESGQIGEHNEYGLPVEEKPLVFSPAPALPDLQELPEVFPSTITSTTLGPLITSPHSIYGVPENEVSTTPAPLGHYPARSAIISHYGEPVQVPLSLLS